MKKEFKEINKDIALVYMVAGISSRFGGKIKQFAKVGHEGETLIEYSLKQAIPAGFTKIIFIVGNKTQLPFKEKFKDNFQDIPVKYVLQTYDESERDKPWGTVDALCSLESIIDCPFVICNGDDIYGKNTFKTLVNHLQEDYNNEEATIGYKLIEVIPEKGKTNRGIFQVKANYVQKIKEVFNIDKTDLNATNTKPDDLCSMNIYALHPETVYLLNLILEEFKENHKNDRKAECLLPTEISKLIENQKIRMKIYPASDKWYGVTNPSDEEILRNILKSKLT